MDRKKRGNVDGKERSEGGKIQGEHRKADAVLAFNHRGEKNEATRSLKKKAAQPMRQGERKRDEGERWKKSNQAGKCAFLR